jgi:hypothetical protein
MTSECNHHYTLTSLKPHATGTRALLLTCSKCKDQIHRLTKKTDTEIHTELEQQNDQH